jgi:hypothetical protein
MIEERPVRRETKGSSRYKTESGICDACEGEVMSFLVANEKGKEERERERQNAKTKGLREAEKD